MKISGLQKLTLLDYPEKTAATVFFSGCNLRCPFCHNADLVLTAGEGDIDESEVLGYLKKRVGILDGVCITGGEPLLQKDLEDFIKKIKDLGYKVKLDTNGTFPDKLSHLLSLSLLDYVAMDVKNAPEKYCETSGAQVDCDKILSSIDILKNSGIDHEFRTTLVSQFHTPEDVAKIAKILGGSEKYFLQKFVDSHRLICDGLSALSDEIMQKCLKEAQKYVPLAQLRGM